MAQTPMLDLNVNTGEFTQTNVFHQRGTPLNRVLSSPTGFYVFPSNAGAIPKMKAILINIAVQEAERQKNQLDQRLEKLRALREGVLICENTGE